MSPGESVSWLGSQCSMIWNRASEPTSEGRALRVGYRLPGNRIDAAFFPQQVWVHLTYGGWLQEQGTDLVLKPARMHVWRGWSWLSVVGSRSLCSELTAVVFCHVPCTGV